MEWGTEGNCPTTVIIGDSLVVIPHPQNGSYFINWTGGCTGNLSCAFPSISSPETITAVFSNVPTLNTGLIAWWKFEDTSSDKKAFDSSGNGFNGVLEGPSIGFGPGKFDKQDLSILNTGYVNDVNIGNAKMTDGLQTMSVSLWFNTSDIHNGTLMSRIDGDRHGGWLMYYLSSPQGVSFTVITNKGPVSASYTGGSNNEWHLVTGVFDGNQGTLQLYFDGVLQATQTTIDNTATPFTGSTVAAAEDGTMMEIGDMNSDKNVVYTGNIDDVRIYNRAQTGTDINQLYDQPVIRTSA